MNRLLCVASRWTVINIIFAVITMIFPTHSRRDFSAFGVSFKSILLLDVHRLKICYAGTLKYLENKIVFYARFHVDFFFICV